MKPLRMAYLAALVAGVGFFVTSVAWLGVWPARVLDQQARAYGPATMMGLSESEARGRVIYAREGCAYCHTQQIRFTGADQARFGAPTLAWESRRDVPHMLGTRRIGPDLSRARGTRSEDWHLAHFFDPRAVVADSVMPSYRHLFDDAGSPKQEARDLVAYIETLGRARELADMDEGIVLSASPARPRRSGPVPEIAAGDAGQGSKLYEGLCASCHGQTGLGDGPAAAMLTPKPANLQGHWYSRERLAQALWNGVPGTSMPAWRDRSLAELAALVAFVPRVGLAPGAVRDDLIRASPEDAALGARVYVENCAQCHGTAGAGDGSAAGLLPVAPTNFRLQRPSEELALRALREGIAGTMMASWTSRLGETELRAVARYVREFSR